MNSKQLYSLVTQTTETFLNSITHHNGTKALLLIVFHNLFLCLGILYLMFGKMNTLYILFMLFMVLVLISNLLFRGCFLMKLERKYLNNKHWYGAYHLLEFFGIELNNDNVRKYFYIWGFIVTMIPFTRFFVL